MPEFLSAFLHHRPSRRDEYLRQKKAAAKESSIMKNNILIIGIMMVLLGAGLAGCKQETSKTDFVGTWMNAAQEGYSWKSITLNEDGTAELTYWNNNTASPCTWKVEAGKLVVNDAADKVLIDLDFKFGGRKSKLVLSGTPENVVMTGDGTYIKQ
jgi:hypothetical protein